MVRFSQNGLQKRIGKKIEGGEVVVFFIQFLTHAIRLSFLSHSLGLPVILLQFVWTITYRINPACFSTVVYVRYCLCAKLILQLPQQFIQNSCIVATENSLFMHFDHSNTSNIQLSAMLYRTHHPQYTIIYRTAGLPQFLWTTLVFSAVL